MLSILFTDVNAYTAFEYLREKRMVGAEVDSAARHPPPRCHPNAHKDLRDHIANSFDDPARAMVVFGPAGVGKTAIAQTMAEEFKASDRLGASLFFSGRGDRNDPDKVVPTLVYQLALTYPEYKNLVFRRLSIDPTILDKTLRVQFEELITKPFQQLGESEIPLRTSVVVLDGLDECTGKMAQRELLELIGNYVQEVPSSPLWWMISSRPEPHLKDLLSQEDFQGENKCTVLSVDEAGSQQAPNMNPLVPMDGSQAFVLAMGG
ncbi:hypothetical protein P691DRAFT_767752 [Macrolepiota fuliginosa MF-IS2]|uniref:NACHT domain-containing protein n=1 Tax=Macrolepiota fuliginosa MF-IS2 TaxID=1400762 RepID=A0A9P5WXT6_9AGAR|nr:hypothetical protein P691DRAFT_767752 [Macrolepiota fuliginosa MF-IS2]